MYVGEVPKDQLWSIINVNIGATTMMTRIVLEGMKKRGKGAIVNVSSGSECQPLPFMTVYAASKVSMHIFHRLYFLSVRPNANYLSQVRFIQISIT
jgi:17beta-estradiol 17-dehydrogenase / very-long-chain 3-oxoacyl-CoA reductase